MSADNIEFAVSLSRTMELEINFCGLNLENPQYWFQIISENCGFAQSLGKSEKFE